MHGGLCHCSVQTCPVNVTQCSDLYKTSGMCGSGRELDHPYFGWYGPNHYYTHTHTHTYTLGFTFMSPLRLNVSSFASCSSSSIASSYSFLFVHCLHFLFSPPPSSLSHPYILVYHVLVHTTYVLTGTYRSD